MPEDKEKSENLEMNVASEEKKKKKNILFLLRCDDVPLERCAELMNVSVSTVKRLNRRLKDKIDKLYK